jgi:TetR/AcrR family transcriptional regulator
MRGVKRPAAAPPRNRTRNYVRRDERRRQILDAAAELFARGGFAGTTTRQIAAAVGTTETVLFRHFPTKESLYAAILEDRVPAASVDHFLAHLRSLAARHDDQALFRAVAEAILESFRRDTVYHRLMMYASLEGHDLARIGRSKYSSPFLGFLREYIARRQSEGAFKRMRPEWVVHVLVATTTHYAQWTALGENLLGLTEGDVARQAVALVLGLEGGA